jgi:hypothetical protein
MSRVEQALLALSTMPATALGQEWARVHGTPAQRISPGLLRLGIAYRLQEKALGGLPRRTAKALANMTAQKRMAPMLKPGTRLVRSWNGRTINVLVEDDGSYVFEDQRYRSLSAIARAVTGTAWSGPRFFGLAGTAQNG